MRVEGSPLDLSRSFLPEALAGLSGVRTLAEDDRRWMNQIRAASYIHVFDALETSLAEAARAHAARDVDARDTLVPLLRLDSFDHNELFRGFERAFEESFPVAPKLAARPDDLDEILVDAVPLSLLVVALHLKLVTQQHYLACVRGDESLEPSFVKVLKEHWTMECGRTRGASSALQIQHALAAALPGRVPAALRDYRRIVFTIDDVLRRQAALDVETLEVVRDARLSSTERGVVLDAQFAAFRKTFITFGIVNAAFVYAMRSLGPTAPATLAGVVSALSSR
ncbi:MAG: hypothetical protein KF764_14775, partial [Labilithrix sp.]|nr:hypothetical protein [Labilithrix sp.]